ncbi:hypothetical protein V493_05843, partial [Pseudogymnoascus sp. VKM F-4281 (FW-2241)]
MPSLSLRPSIRSRASSHSNMLHARSPASGSPSPGGGMERSSYFMTSASASSPSAEMARYTSSPWMNGPASGYTPTSQLPPQQQQQSTPQIQTQQVQTQSDLHNRSHRPGADTHTSTPLSARGAAENLGSYFSPWSSECAHTPPLGSRGTDDDLKRSEQDGFFAQGITHTSSSTSSTSASVPQIHLQQRHTHAHSQTRPRLRPAPPRNAATFPLSMAVAQGKYHPSNYRNPEMPTSQFSTDHPSAAG